MRWSTISNAAERSRSSNIVDGLQNVILNQALRVLIQYHDWVYKSTGTVPSGNYQ